MPVTTKLDWKLLKYKMAKYIDVDALNWYDDLFMKGVNHSGVWVTLVILRGFAGSTANFTKIIGDHLSTMLLLSA